MGVDIYLNSIWGPWSEGFQRSGRAKEIMKNAENPVRGAEAMYDVFRSSGGYFRNGYNSGDVMWAMGLSWQDTVSPMLDAEGHLPVEKARELLAMIEERPLTKERLARHYFEHMTNGREEHPVRGRTYQMMLDAADAAAGYPPQPAGGG